jgi:hypothetical protein
MLAGTVLASACAPDQPTGVRVPSDASLGKAATGVTVTATNPSYAHRGETGVKVRVLGTGFTSGAKAKWILGTDSTSVTVNSTTFISSTELEADITVTGSAPLDLYDVRVMLTDGKKGVGAEKFAVTTATLLGFGPVGDAIVQDVNDLGQVVGYFDAGGGPFVYDGTNNVLLEGSSGQPFGISPTGDVIIGRDSKPVAWIRQPSGAYVREIMPTIPGGTGNGGAMNIAVSPTGQIIVGGYVGSQLSKRTNVTHAVLWTRSGSTWATPTVYASPGEVAASFDLSRTGQLMGRMAFSGSTDIRWGVWDDVNTFVPLNGPWLNAMNKKGTLVVGVLSTGAALWYRDVTSGQWNPDPILLPKGGECGNAGNALDVNDAGIVVGGGCFAGYWRVDDSVSPPTISGPFRLVGLGGGFQVNVVSQTAPYTIAGSATVGNGGKRAVVKWVIE